MGGDGRGAGRWRRHAEAVRSERAAVRMTPDERVVLEAAAARRGLRLSGFLVEAGLAVAGRPDPGPAAPAAATAGRVSVDRELLAALAECNRLLRQYGNNVNQAVTALHATGQAPVWLGDAVRLTSGVTRRVDALVNELRRRRS